MEIEEVAAREGRHVEIFAQLGARLIEDEGARLEEGGRIVEGGEGRLA